MKRIGKSILLVAAIAFLGGCVPHTTGDTEVGVRTVKFGIFAKKGVEDKIYAPGSTFIFLPFVNDWHTFDTKLQNLEMTIRRGVGDRQSKDDLLFKTIDGNDISLDVIIAYRIDPQRAPYILQNVAEDDHMLREKIIRTIARSKPRDIFGELKTEEFYDAAGRDKKAEDVTAELQKILGPMGIIMEKVLTKDYRFNPEYQKAIEDKKVADQMMQKNRSAQAAAVQEYARRIEDAKGEVNKLKADADGEYQKAVIEADAYYDKMGLIAKAITAEGEAEAQGIEKMNEALTGSGGETLVKLRVAEAMAGKRYSFLPLSEGGMNLKTTDVNGLIQMLGVKSLSGGAGQK